MPTKINEWIDEAAAEYASLKSLDLPSHRQLWRDLIVIARMIELNGMDRAVEYIQTTRYDHDLLIEIVQKFNQIE